MSLNGRIKKEGGAPEEMPSTSLILIGIYDLLLDIVGTHILFIIVLISIPLPLKGLGLGSGKLIEILIKQTKMGGLIQILLLLFLWRLRGREEEREKGRRKGEEPGKKTRVLNLLFPPPIFTIMITIIMVLL